jgi:hypothetical protein
VDSFPIGAGITARPLVDGDYFSACSSLGCVQTMRPSSGTQSSWRVKPPSLLLKGTDASPVTLAVAGFANMVCLKGWFFGSDC